MKKIVFLLLTALLLTGCSSNTVAEVTVTETQPAAAFTAPQYISRFDSVTEITLSDSGITVNGGEEPNTVFTSNDIVYYEDKDFYPSGNPYGEGTDSDKHTAEEAAAHTVVNITAPGTYRLSGTLSAGQIRIDLGEDAYSDPNAVVELILTDTDITCTVAPAILFLSTYECDGSRDTATAQPTVDTTAAGANLILEGCNTVTGSHVARIYKDTEEEKKLWKQDAAVYSYTSMNVFGPGSLDITADNEGLDTELHLTINGGDITIRSGNDGINTNEDGVSVTTINGGNLLITAGLGDEGDGIDSNGYLVINSGTVIASANPAADAGMDSDLGSYIHGGTVIALGSTMDWAESDSNQVTMNLQFSQPQTGVITLTDEGDSTLFTFDPAEIFGEYARQYTGAILSSPTFTQGSTCRLYVDGVQMQYTGTDVRRMPGGMGFGGGMGNMVGQRPEGDFENMAPPEGFTGERPAMPEGQRPELPEGETFPADFDPGSFGGRGSEKGENMTGERPELPDSFDPTNRPQTGNTADPNTRFYMQDKVNAFSGITTIQ